MITANEKLQEAFIRRAITLERYKSSVVNDIVRFMNTEMEPDLLSRIERKLDGTLTKKRLQETEEVVVKTVSEYTARTQDIFKTEMTAFAKSEADWVAITLAKAAAIEFTINAPSVELMSKILDKGLINGRYFADYMKEFDVATQQSVLQQIRLGIAEGQSIDAITRRIKGTRANGYTDGILDRPRRSIQTLVRTTVAGVMSDARMAVYEGNQDVIKGWQFLAILDLRTSVQCAYLDHKVFNIGEGQIPPIHYNCRSTHMPVLKSWKELGFDMEELPAGTRASMDGQVPANTTFEEWIKTKSEADQNKVFGVGRAKLWRDGKINLKDMVDQKYQPITLKNINIGLADELQEGYNKKYAFANNLGSLRFDYQNNVVKQLDRLIKAYPDVRLDRINVYTAEEYIEKFAKYGVNKPKTLANAGFWADKDNFEINFNGSFHMSSRIDVASKLKARKEIGIFAYGKPEDVMTHEFGHLMLKGMPKGTIIKLEAYYEANKSDLKQISLYAGKNFREMFAESFLQYRHAQASPRAREVMKITGIIK